MRKSQFILNKFFVDPTNYNLKKQKISKLSIFEFNKEESIIIPNPCNIRKKLKKFKDDGIKNLEIVSDFDNTFNIKDFRGKGYDTSVGVLKHSEYNSKMFQINIKMMYGYYYDQIFMVKQMDLDKTDQDRILSYLTGQWYILNANFLKQEKISKERLERVLNQNKFLFRHGLLELLSHSQEYEVPLTIISNGYGDIIQCILDSFAYKHFDKDTLKMVSVIANRICFQNNYLLVNTDEFLNDKQIQLENVNLKDNLILIGDSLNDRYMSQDKDEANVIAFCFLDNNTYTQEQMNDIKQSFDVIIKQNANFDFINIFFHLINGTSDIYLQNLNEEIRSHYDEIIKVLYSNFDQEYDGYQQKILKEQNVINKQQQ